MGSQWSNEDTDAGRDTVTTTTARIATVKKKPSVNCSACFETLDFDHEGIKCSDGHHLCRDTCSKTFLNTVLEDPHLSIPATCSFCKTILKNDIVERVLEPKQLENYRYHLLRITATSTKAEGDMFCSCPFCDYFEYQIGDEEDILFVHCKNPRCGKTSCVICKAAVNKEEKDNFVKSHNTCRNLRKHKVEFDRLLGASNTMACPQCGLAGMKDINCSHITCPKCLTDWCYVCGLKRNDLNLEDGEPFSTHYLDWKIYESRCPMYLQNISEINSDFYDDPRAALQKFHENRSKMLLKRFVNVIGEKQFNELRSHFPSVENCGFTLTEIRNAPEHVFRPPTNLANLLMRKAVVAFQTAIDQPDALFRGIVGRDTIANIRHAGQSISRNIWSLADHVCLILCLWLGRLVRSTRDTVNSIGPLRRAGEVFSSKAQPFGEAFMVVFFLLWLATLLLLHSLITERPIVLKLLYLILIGILCLWEWLVVFYVVYMLLFYVVAGSVVLSFGCVVWLWFQSL